tara:strand:- start:56 stop:250 length:195 start_codon:yes stop_codon:yes gene_type:complete
MGKMHGTGGGAKMLELILVASVAIGAVAFVIWQAIDQLRIFRAILDKPNGGQHWRDVIDHKGNK